MTRPISIFLLVVGLLWGLFVSGLFVVLSAFMGGASTTEPSVIGKGLLHFSWMFVGPFLLITGAILVLLRTHQKAGSILAVVACVILTILVGYQSILSLHVEPLQAKPPYALYAIAVIVTLLSDIGAIRLYQTVSKGRG